MSAMLSFENAPPLSVPARFLASAPWYGVLAGGLMLIEGPSLLDSRWSAATLALTHLLTVGFLMQAMVGALFQFLAVAADAGIARPARPAMAIHIGLNVGTLALAGGFYFAQSWLLATAGGLLGASVALFVFLALRGLLARKHSSPTIPALKLALGGLLVTAGFGLYLLGVYGFGVTGRAANLTAQHAAWGLIGWSSTLVAGIAYVVVPMFQLTPGYSKRFGNTFVPVLWAILLLWTAVQWFDWNVGIVLAGALAAVALGVFAAVTLGLQGRSKRAAPDATTLFWRLAMLCTLLAGGLWAAFPAVVSLGGGRLEFALGVLAIVGVLMSVVGGMLYKIVPFLCWLHVQQYGFEKGIYKTPHMGVFLAESRMRLQFFAQVAALALMLAAVAFPLLVGAAGVAAALSFGLLGTNLLMALRTMRIEKARLQ